MDDLEMDFESLDIEDMLDALSEPEDIPLEDPLGSDSESMFDIPLEDPLGSDSESMFDLQAYIDEVSPGPLIESNEMTQLRRFFSANGSGYFKQLRGEEKRLREIIIRSAEHGELELLKRAVDVLKQIDETRPSWPNIESRLRKQSFLDFHDESLYSPLMHACQEGRPAVAEYLLQKTASVTYVGKVSSKPSKKLKSSGLTAMHAACVSGSVEVVNLLIALDNLTASDATKAWNATTTRDKWTPLMYAVRHGHADVVKRLIESGFVIILVTNKKKQTVLHVAGRWGQLECLKLIHSKLPPERVSQVEDNPYLVQDKNGHNVLHSVSCGPKGSVPALKWLLEVMPFLNTPELLNLGSKPKGFNMLLTACDNFNMEMVDYLLSLKGVDVSACTADGKTGLHLAAIHDYTNLAKKLVEHDINLVAQDEKGDTGLHIAMKKSSFEVVEVIRTHDRDGKLKSITNKAGQTPDTITPEEVIPKEIERLGDDAIRQYQQALRKGKKKKMPRCNLIVLGEQEVGKTSLLRLLMKKKFIPNLDRTRGIDNSHVGVVDTKSICSKEWKEVNPLDQVNKEYAVSLVEQLGLVNGKISAGRNKEGRRTTPALNMIELRQEVENASRLIDRVKLESQRSPPLQFQAFSLSVKTRESHINKLPKPPRDTLPTDHPTQQKRPRKREDEVPHKDLEALASNKSKPVPQQQPFQDTLSNQQALSKATPEPPKSEQPLSRSMRRYLVSAAKRKQKEVEPHLNLNTLDFAGQKIYRPMHHCFIVRRAIYLVVFNLQEVQKSLDSEDPDKENAVQEISYWLHSIHAHVHKICKDPGLKRVILVGTHRDPSKEQTITKEGMIKIEKYLEKKFSHGPISNDLRFVYPIEDNESDEDDEKKGEVFAAVENSIDSPKPKAREESGASLIQSEIQKAWDDLPFKSEQYPTTWLRFEAKLHRMTPISRLDDIKKLALDFHIGENGEEEVELALGFFHDTGALIYFKKLPSLYLDPSEKEYLDGFVLRDPTLLTNAMKQVMELKIGTSTNPNMDINELNEKGTAKVEILEKCWAELYKEGQDVSFKLLLLLLQSFCLIFPIARSGPLSPQKPHASPKGAVSSQLPAAASPRSFSDSPTSTPTEYSQYAQQDDQTSKMTTTSPSEASLATERVATYLIPSMLPHGDSPPSAELIARCKKAFYFDFKGFLPDEVYHRLLCLMLRDKPTKNTSELPVTANYFKINGVQGCNWLIKKKDTKLEVFVAYSDRSDKSPLKCMSLLHSEYLSKICNEEGSSLQGLQYVGGPSVDCSPKCERSGILPCVKYPADEDDNEKECKEEIECEECFQPHDVNKLLDPKEQMAESVAESKANGSCMTHKAVSQEATDQGHLTPTSAAELPVPLLSVAVLQEVMELLVDVKKEWYSLGLALGLRDPTLKEIKQNEDDIGDRKREMVSEWLNQVDNCKPTYPSLEVALRNSTVKCNAIAENVRKHRTK